MSMAARRARAALIRSPLEFAFILGSILFASCSLTVDADRVQCQTKADCAARGGAFTGATCVDSVCQIDPAWACLSTGSPPASTQEPPYKLVVQVRGVVDQSPKVGAQVKLCRKLDVDCASPIGTGVSDSGGNVNFSVDMKGFTGYVHVLADGFVPSLFFFNPPIDRDTTVPVSLATTLENQGLLFTLGRQPSAGHGNVVISSRDCTGAPAADVSYSSPNADAMTSSFYTVSDLPTGAATATDAGGYGGLINLPVGAATVIANLASPKVELGRISLLVQDGAITYSTVVPLAN